MIVEMREYTLHAGKVPEYLQLYEREGLEIQREILGHLVGYYTTEVGEAVNQVVHLWAYESFEDRDARRDFACPKGAERVACRVGVARAYEARHP